MWCRVRTFAVVLAWFCVACGHGAALGATSLSPQQIFFNTFKRLEAYSTPAYFVEVSTWHTPGGSLSWRYAVRASDHMENYTAMVPGDGNLPSNAWVKPGFVGPMAWLVRPPPAAPHAPLPDMPDVPDLRTIASVVSYRPDYQIRVVGIETMRGHHVYHLMLKPYGDPLKHNLRDLWSDVDTYDLWAARVMAKCGFCDTPRPTTVAFEPVADTWIVLVTSFEGPCGAGTCSYEILTDKIVFVPSLPDWLFDEAEYRVHQQAHEPDYLAPLIDPPKPSPSPNQ